jgi:hypothetical protein
MHAQSENISLHDILLANAFLIPEGSTVELAVAVGRMPNPDLFLTSRGRVLRVRMKGSGDFAVAIEFERPFELTRGSSNFAEYL